MPPKQVTTTRQTPRFVTRAPDSAQRRPVPRFVTTPASANLPAAQSKSKSKSRPVFLPPSAAAQPSTPTPSTQAPSSSRIPFIALSTTPDPDLPSDSIDEDSQPANSSPILPRKRRWGTAVDGDDVDLLSSSPPLPESQPTVDEELASSSQLESLQTPPLCRTGRDLPFTPSPFPLTSTSTHVPNSAGGAPLFSRLRELRGDGGRDDTAKGSLLPVNWSPTKRRGSGKYLEDGLAATVTGWVLETRSAQGRKQGGELVVAAVRVEETFIAVTTEQEIRGGEGLAGFLLVKSQMKLVRPGSIVRFDWPWWEVEVEGKKWRMSVFWTVVNGEGRPVEQTPHEQNAEMVTGTLD